MTDNEIIKALECCIKECDYEHCPYYVNDRYECGDNFNKDILDLINRQKAEIERLQKSIELMKGAKCVYSYDGETLEYCTSSPCPISKTVDQIKAEAVKEFAERLKEELEGEYIKATNKLENAQNIVVSTSIKIVDNLVKEMAGDDGD